MEAIDNISYLWIVSAK